MSEADEAQAAMVAETGELVDAIKECCHQHSTRAILSALAEVYGRVMSDTISHEADMEQSLVFFTTHARGWWLADRGQPYRPS